MWTIFSRLGTHLAQHSRAGAREVTLTFGEIEALLGRRLPQAARTKAAWWQSPPEQHGPGNARWYGWLSVGWAAEPDLGKGTVTFRYTRSDP